MIRKPVEPLVRFGGLAPWVRLAAWRQVIAAASPLMDVHTGAVVELFRAVGA